MKIKCAAIIFGGKIYEGENHAKIGCWMVLNGDCPRPFPSGNAQGFVTDEGKFVTRAEAMQIAIASGQVTAGTTYHKTDLFSEDLKYCRGPKRA